MNVLVFQDFSYVLMFDVSLPVTASFLNVTSLYASVEAANSSFFCELLLFKFNLSV